MAGRASVDWYRTLIVHIHDPNFNSQTFREQVGCLLRSDDYPIETAHRFAIEARTCRCRTDLSAVTSASQLACARTNFEEFLTMHDVRQDIQYKRAFQLLKRECTANNRWVRELTQMREKLFIIWEVATEMALSHVTCPEEQYQGSDQESDQEHNYDYSEEEESAEARDIRQFGLYLPLVKDLPRS